MAAFAGALASVTLIGGVVGALVFGWLKDIGGARNSAYIGFACGVFALGLFVLSLANSHAVLMLVAGGLFGAFAAMGPVNNPLILAEAYGTKNYAAIFSFITTGTTLMGGFGVAIIGTTYDMFGSYFPAMYSMMVLCGVGAVLVGVGVSSAKKLPRDV